MKFEGNRKEIGQKQNKCLQNIQAIKIFCSFGFPRFIFTNLFSDQSIWDLFYKFVITIYNGRKKIIPSVGHLVSLWTKLNFKTGQIHVCSFFLFCFILLFSLKYIYMYMNVYRYSIPGLHFTPTCIRLQWLCYAYDFARFIMEYKFYLGHHRLHLCLSSRLEMNYSLVTYNIEIVSRL